MTARLWKAAQNETSGITGHTVDSYMCECMWRCRDTARNQNVFDAILADIVVF